MKWLLTCASMVCWLNMLGQKSIKQKNNPKNLLFGGINIGLGHAIILNSDKKLTESKIVYGKFGIFIEKRSLFSVIIDALYNPVKKEYMLQNTTVKITQSNLLYGFGFAHHFVDSFANVSFIYGFKTLNANYNYRSSNTLFAPNLNTSKVYRSVALFCGINLTIRLYRNFSAAMDLNFYYGKRFRSFNYPIKATIGLGISWGSIHK